MQSSDALGAMDSTRGELTTLIRGLVPGTLLGNKPPPQLADYPTYLQLVVQEGLVPMDVLLQLARQGRTAPAAAETTLLPLTGREKLLAALAAHYGVMGIDLEQADISPQVALMVPEDVGQMSHVACVDINEDGMTLAMVDPNDEQAVAVTQSKTDFKVVKRMVVLASDLKAFQEVLYGTPRSLPVSPRDIVDDIIKQAIRLEASDVHIEPLQDEIVVRYRKDGVLISTFDIRDVAPRKVLVRHLKTSIPVVVKNKSGASGKTMNIAENQKPQDGRIYLPGRGLDLRVSVLPSVHGESIVIRIHRTTEDEVDFARLGFTDRNLEAFLSIISAPYGILMVSGPTGSGKTTTLYSVLRHLNDPGKKIVTIEDPVECVIPRITQVQTNPAKGVTFAEALRSFLRHDPDIIMVGEVRDHETAVMAVEASLTGHLVLSSIHANDAVRTITRLKDLGVNPLLITSTCLGTLAQRLLRKNCPHCSKKARFSPRFQRLMERYQVPHRRENLMQGTGCPRCNHTGYLGRTGIFELMVITPEMRDAINRHASDADLERLARRQGMRLLIEDALVKAAQGLTTEAEVLRVTLADTFATRSEAEERASYPGVGMEHGFQAEASLMERTAPQLWSGESDAPSLPDVTGDPAPAQGEEEEPAPPPSQRGRAGARPLLGRDGTGKPRRLRGL